MAKYLQCSECGKLAFYYDDYVGTEKPFYKRFMRYPEGETNYQLPRCFSCGGVPRMIVSLPLPMPLSTSRPGSSGTGLAT